MAKKTIQKPKKTKIVKKRHKNLFNDWIDSLKKGKMISFGALMRKHGYSDSYSRVPKLLWSTESFQSLLKQIPDDLLLIKTVEEALSDTDKRNATKNREMLFDLKGYKEKKIRLGKLDESLEKICD